MAVCGDCQRQRELCRRCGPMSGQTRRARSILSWGLTPTDCNYTPIWGNAPELSVSASINKCQAREPSGWLPLPAGLGAWPSSIPRSPLLARSHHSVLNLIQVWATSASGRCHPAGRSSVPKAQELLGDLVAIRHAQHLDGDMSRAYDSTRFITVVGSRPVYCSQDFVRSSYARPAVLIPVLLSRRCPGCRAVRLCGCHADSLNSPCASRTVPCTSRC